MYMLIPKCNNTSAEAGILILSPPYIHTPNDIFTYGYTFILVLYTYSVVFIYFEYVVF